MVINNNDNTLDPISLLVLLILSGGQRFGILEISRILNRPFENIALSIQILQNRQFIRNERGRFMIDNRGIEFLALRGISSVPAEDEPQRNDFIRQIRPPFFSSWTEMFIWLSPPLILLIPAFVLSALVTAGYNFISLDKRILQIFVWIAYLAFCGFYFWFSNNNVLENESLVVFRGGRVQGRRGPGKVLLLPLIDNPRRVDMRERTQEIRQEPCLTRDNMLLNAGLYVSWRIENPIASLTRVTNIEDSMSLLVTAMLRAAIAEFNMQDAMNGRRALNTLIRTRIQLRVDDWGIVIDDTEVRDLQPSDGVLRQIENRFNATLERDAELERSNAKVQSLQQFMAIGAGMARNPIAFNLKYLDTLEKIGEGASTKYIIPMELFNMLQEALRPQGNGSTPENGNTPRNENNPPEQLPPGGSVQ